MISAEISCEMCQRVSFRPGIFKPKNEQSQKLFSGEANSVPLPVSDIVRGKPALKSITRTREWLPMVKRASSQRANAS